MGYFRSIAGRIVSCILYLIGGVFTGGTLIIFGGFHASLRSDAIAGDVMLVGSLLLLAAAVTALFNFHGTGYIALTGVIAIWFFYVSMIIASMTRAHWTSRMVSQVALMTLIFVVSVTYPIASIVSMRRESV